MTYQYVNPTLQGYQRLKVSRKKHNRMFPNCKSRIGGTVEYYFNKESGTLIIQRFTSGWVKPIILLLGVVPSVLLYGLFKTVKEAKSIIFERERGHFVEDRYFLNHNAPAPGSELEELLIPYIED